MRCRTCRYMLGLVVFNEMHSVKVYVEKIERENN